MSKAIPEGFHSITPTFTFTDARKAIEFYKQAFGAQERFVMPGPDGKGVMHAEIIIGDSIVMFGEESPQNPCKSAQTMGGSPIGFYFYVEDVDKAFRRALEAGAQVRMQVADMFWGDRVGSVQDPFGFNWTLATHIKDPTRQELEEGAQAACAQMQKG
ncbi:VOC family protein [Geomesophilobacter sediminis]|uniref:VOC family protein n=1 Tax=Geomesophilobacter sediminis TaxID=2798584 RepID=A0A8J7LXI8_9BACT|nr:VOC family protein [Geomesophilobacter sediminis]MBJ6723232.1 VOC family protein [Geomesophilobacter sediminis]